MAGPNELRAMYARYMKVPAVADWLIQRAPGADFLSAAPENCLLVSLAPASQPGVLPAHLPSAPFQQLHDLAFLDHVQDGYALGHVRCIPHCCSPTAVIACNSFSPDILLCSGPYSASGQCLHRIRTFCITRWLLLIHRYPHSVELTAHCFLFGSTSYRPMHRLDSRILLQFTLFDVFIVRHQSSGMPH